MTHLIHTRRQALLGTALGLSTAVAASSQAEEALVRRPPAFTAPAAPRALAFDPAKLDGISEKLVRSHWENNYSGALKALGVVKERLGEMNGKKDVPAYIYNDLKREHLIRTGSVVLHELYFDNLGGTGQAGANLRSRIAQAFGSFDAWETEFRTMGAGLGGGSGWVVLGYNTHTHSIENYWLADHGHSPAATLPLLVMDMYEHAYQMDYGAAAAKYVDAFFRNIQWDVVEKRLEGAKAYSV